jgi:2-aminoethylphosphonate transport system substrate-binding protein
MSRIVATGYALAANGDLQEDLNDVDQYGKVVVWFPSGGDGRRTTIAFPYGAAHVRGGRNPDNAKALLTYLWSQAGQSLVGASYGAPARPDVVPGDTRSLRIRDALRGVDVRRPDWTAIARDQDQLVGRWLAVQRAPEGAPLPAPATTTTVPFPPP